jgi:uncharacterized protein YqkB
MGEGIKGAIPISFRFAGGYYGFNRERNKAEFQKYAADDVFDFYNEAIVKIPKGDGGGTETLYTIKPEILLPNFKDFFLEFNGLIRDDWALEADNISMKFNAEYDSAVASGDLDLFLKHFDDHTGRAPQISSNLGALYIEDYGEFLFVYQGSYKAYLEVWSTLEHIELLLRAAVRNPLAKVVRFGIS